MVAAVAPVRGEVCVLVQPSASSIGAGIRRVCEAAGLTVVVVTDSSTPAADGSSTVDLRDEAAVRSTAARITADNALRALVIVNELGDGVEFGTADPVLLRERMEEPCVRFFNTTQAFWSAVAQASGAIVNVVPVRGTRGAVPMAAEAMARGVLWQLTRSLAVELAEFGVTVNGVVVAPLDDGQSTAMRRSPLRRGPTADEVGASVSFLISPASRCTTGTFVQLDGGNTAKL